MWTALALGKVLRWRVCFAGLMLNRVVLVIAKSWRRLKSARVRHETRGIRSALPGVSRASGGFAVAWGISAQAEPAGGAGGTDRGHPAWADAVRHSRAGPVRFPVPENGRAAGRDAGLY